MKNIVIHLFRLICHPSFREEVEGDILEQYYQNKIKWGKRKANVLLFKEVAFLVKPAITDNLKHTIFITMNTKQLSRLVLTNLFFLGCIALPFLPGPYNVYAIGASGFSQFIGFMGLLLVPIGIVWAFFEHRFKVDELTLASNWSNGFYFAISALLICLIMIAILITLSTIILGVSVGAILAMASLTIVLYFIPKMSRLRKPGRAKQSAPYYLIFIPLICLLGRVAMAPRLSDFSRSYVIEKAQTFIPMIEDYKNRNGHYPITLDDLGMPRIKSNFMGVEGIKYERTSSGYKLSFIQWLHIGATQEIVSYSSTNQHGIKNHFASFETDQKNWKYFWLD